MAGAAGAAGTWMPVASRNTTTGSTCVDMATVSASAITLTRLVAPASRLSWSRLESSRRLTRTRNADAVVVAAGTPANATRPASGFEAAATVSREDA